MLLSNEISKLPNSVYSLRKKTHQDSLIFSNALKSENSKVFVKKRKTLQITMNSFHWVDPQEAGRQRVSPERRHTFCAHAS